MTDQHPITPPPELVEQWRIAPEYASGLKKLMMVTMTEQRLQEIATQAARWGADQELEACCEWLDEIGPLTIPLFGNDLRIDRRPKPKGLAEPALQAIAAIKASDGDYRQFEQDIDSICAALERLQELEG